MPVATVYEFPYRSGAPPKTYSVLYRSGAPPETYSVVLNRYDSLALTTGIAFSKQRSRSAPKQIAPNGLTQPASARHSVAGLASLEAVHDVARVPPRPEGEVVPVEAVRRPCTFFSFFSFFLCGHSNPGAT